MAYDFHWWVHSVLPLVFDNSLSYYEVLAKLTNYVDGLTGDVKKITDVLGTIEGIEDVTQFTEYLNSINDKIGELDGLDTESKNNLVAAVNEAYELAKNAYVKPAGGIPERDLSQELINKINSSGGSSGGSGGGTTNYQALSNLPSINGVTLFGNVTGQSLGLGTYTKPSGGIPMDDLSTAVQNAIAAGGGGSGGSGVTDYDALTNRPQINGNTLTGNKTAAQLGLGTYNLPADGIPWSQLSEDVQTRISAGGGSGGGVTDYSALTGKPSINGHVLNSGNNDLATLGIGTYSLPAGGIPENQLNPTLANKINQAYNGVSTNDTKFSGIASQLSNFTTDRRYEAGELLYINGIMYKTKNVILAGSTLVEGNNIERATVSDEIVRLNELEQKINASSNFNSFDINSEVRMNSTIETPVKVVEGINCIGGESYLINFYMENYNFQSGLLITIKIKGHLDNVVYSHAFSAGESVNVQSITFEPTDTDTYYITAEYQANNGPAVRIYMSVKYTTSQGITYIHDMLESLEGVPDDVAAAVELVEQQQQRIGDFEDEYGDIPERVEILENDVNILKETIDGITDITGINYNLETTRPDTSSFVKDWDVNLDANIEYEIELVTPNGIKANFLFYINHSTSYTTYTANEKHTVTFDSNVTNVQIYCGSGLTTIAGLYTLNIHSSGLIDNLNTSVNELSEDIDDINDALQANEIAFNTFARFDLGELVAGYIKPSTGGLEVNDNYRATPMLAIGVGKITLPVYFRVNTGIAFYNKDQNFIPGSGIDGGDYTPNSIITVDVPENARYFRACALTNLIDNFYITAPNVVNYILKDFEPNEEVNPCLYLDSSSARVFKKILCIGDSLTEGTFNYGANGLGGSFFDTDLSYPTYLKCMTGRDTYNAGDAGQSTKTWWNLHQNDDLSGFDACIIELGLNDVAGSSAVQCTSEERIAAVNNIINKLKTQNTGIKIFISTLFRMYTNPSHLAVNTDLRTIANSTPDCYLLDIAQHGTLSTYLPDRFNHLTAIGYERLARDYFNYISYIIDTSNAEEFAFVQFIGTEYSPN